ncbi:MAG: Response regulator protein TmoT, partial [Pseudomonadota bacterium]
MTPDNGHVVLIDDSDDVRRHLGNLIRQMGYSLESYERAEDFLARAVDHEPCVLLLDMRMPGLTGLEVQQALIARSRLFPIIYISGESKMQEVIDSMKLGALDFLIKPVRHADLARVLESAMAVGRTRCEARMRQTRLADRVAQLSQRERDIFDLIVKGFPN